MSMSDTEYRDTAPNRVADLAVNSLYRIGLDLRQALTLVGPQAGQRIHMAISRIDETIDELRHAIMSDSVHR